MKDLFGLPIRDEADLAVDIRRVPKSYSHIMVDTTPADVRAQGTINLGMQIAADLFQARIVSWRDKIDLSKHKTIFANVYYPPHAANLCSFLSRNGVSPFRSMRRNVVFAGGPGIGRTGTLQEIADELCPQEIDFIRNRHSVTSKAYHDGRKGVIELTRGCRMKCSFCEYSVERAPYREKPIDLVVEQCRELSRLGVKSVNFMSANWSGYSLLDRLIESAAENGLTILNSDSCVNTARRLIPHARRGLVQSSIRLGIESFDPRTREAIGKPMSNSQLLDLFADLSDAGIGLFHLYLIYGLPGDDYAEWVKMLSLIAGFLSDTLEPIDTLFGPDVQITRKTRFDFSVTNFEPTPGTKLATAPTIDFRDKDIFLSLWSDALRANRFHLGATVGYKNAKGRIGRMEGSYRLIMALRQGAAYAPPKAFPHAFLKAFPKGLKRSIPEKDSRIFLRILQDFIPEGNS